MSGNNSVLLNNSVQNQPSTPQQLKPVILLVEDDPLLHKMYKTKMENDGYFVLDAEDGESGLKIALSQKVDIIVLDMMMPRMSGLDMLKMLRQDSRGKDIIVLVLTNLAEKAKAEEALKLGAKEYLIKANLTPSQIVAKVKQYLGK